MSNVQPNTQPTCGRALKTITIEIRNPKDAQKDTFLFKKVIVNRRAKTQMVQNSVALSRKPKVDQRK
jgi:hypothetical protein